MEGRRPNRRNTNNDRQNNNPFAGPLPNFGISLFAVCNDPEPDELVSDNEENDVEKKKAFCRICLCSDRKLYAIPPQNRSTFRDVLNRDLEEGNPIPQRVCFECNAKMTSFTTFRTRALQTNSLLYTIIRPIAYELPDVSSIDREAHNLTSTLQTKIFSPDHADYHFVYTQERPRTKRDRSEPIHEVILPSLDLEDDDTPIQNYIDFSEENLTQETATVYVNIESSEENLVQEKATIYKKIESSEENLVQEKTTIYKKIESSEENLVHEKTTIYDNIESSKENLVQGKSTKKIQKKKKQKEIIKKVDKRCKPANEVLNNDVFNIIDLNHEEQLYEVNKRQCSSNYKNSVFKCSECFKGFLDEDAFKGHMIRHTDQCGTYCCAICKIRFKKLQALRNHTTSHMQRFSCKRCNYVTFRRNAAKLHEEYHNGTKYVCPHCQENFDKQSTYMSHVRIKHPSDFVCQLCGYSFVSEKGLALHKKLKHRFDDHQVPTDGPWCTKCDIQFVSKEALEKHIHLSARHSDEAKPSKPHARRNHGDQDSSNSDTQVMKKRHTSKPDGPIACEQCDMQLADPLSYYRHFRRVHPDKNRTNYPSMKCKSMCEVCGKMFQSLALLQDHSWTHTDSKQFKCTACDKQFVRKYRLIAHQRVHGDTRATHTCSVCSKSFSTASNMQRHLVIHTGLNPFKCEMCGKCFKHASEKRVHVTYVHLKKPWPQRARGKRNETQNQLQSTMPASDIQPTQTDIPIENKPF